MRKSKFNIGIAFLLNLGFSLIELLGGIFTGSVAILSDSVHDLGDALSIGLSWLLEKKSAARPDKVYTYGYGRYSVLGGVLTTAVLITGSVLVIVQSVGRIFHPTEIHYDQMIWLSVLGVVINLGAAFVTHEGDSVNQKAVNLHMLEDVLGWIVVLAGAIIMRFTDLSLIDPLMSIGVALFILISAIKNLGSILDIFLEKAPDSLHYEEICRKIEQLPGVVNVHHLHLWTMDGQNHYATLHAAAQSHDPSIKNQIRQTLRQAGIGHATIEIELAGEECTARECYMGECNEKMDKIC